MKMFLKKYGYLIIQLFGFSFCLFLCYVFDSILDDYAEITCGPMTDEIFVGSVLVLLLFFSIFTIVLGFLFGSNIVSTFKRLSESSEKSDDNK